MSTSKVTVQITGSAMGFDSVSHVAPIYGLSDTGKRAFINDLVTWFVSHDSLDRTRLMSLVAEAEANAS